MFALKAPTGRYLGQSKMSNLEVTFEDNVNYARLFPTQGDALSFVAQRGQVEQDIYWLGYTIVELELCTVTTWRELVRESI